MSERCYVIAEAGSNHNGEWDLAERLIDVAAGAGADAVKFQLFRAERMYPRGAGTADYLGDDTDIYEIIARMELPEEWLPRLAARCDERGIEFLATPFDEPSADALDPFVARFKIASYELTHDPLLRHVAGKGKPVILSTGAADLDEVGHALDVLRDAGATDITLLQCTAAYPTRLEALNVGALAELRERFGVRVGLSDHSEDPVIAPVVAVGAGAGVIEKHFTLDRELPGPDHRFAIEPDGLERMVAAIRDAELALGSGEKRVHDDEQELREFARRSVFAMTDIQAGDVLDESTIAVLRSGKKRPGLPPARYGELLGRRAARAIRAGDPVEAEDVS
ncbi:MAG TPA: N-acetylneuraminate synthase family protein [Gaiellaceae bacterium]|nr:N-acetylneuraminate synthase family protein [Gaiellaceae bacterium]